MALYSGDKVQLINPEFIEMNLFSSTCHPGCTALSYDNDSESGMSKGSAFKQL